MATFDLQCLTVELYLSVAVRANIFISISTKKNHNNITIFQSERERVLLVEQVTEYLQILHEGGDHAGMCIFQAPIALDWQAVAVYEE